MNKTLDIIYQCVKIKLTNHQKLKPKQERKMGYSTDFEGKFEVKPKLSEPAKEYIQKFNSTRRMARKFENDIHGVDGEFYVDGGGFAGQDHEENIMDYNCPPKTQPGLWCQWTATDCGNFIEWDGNEKFRNYIEWLTYMINCFFEPNGYKLNGNATWQGEERSDHGAIHLKDNVITVVENQGSGEPTVIMPNMRIHTQRLER